MLRCLVLITLLSSIFMLRPNAAQASCEDLSTYNKSAIEAIKNRDAARKGVHDSENMDRIGKYMQTASENVEKGRLEPCSQKITSSRFQLAAAWLLMDTVGLYALHASGSMQEKRTCRPIAEAFSHKGLRQAWYSMWLAAQTKPRDEYFDRVASHIQETASVLQISLPAYTVDRSTAQAFERQSDEEYASMKKELEQMNIAAIPYYGPCSFYKALPQPAYINQ